MNVLKRLFGSHCPYPAAAPRRNTRGAGPRLRLEVETLEERSLMSTSAFVTGLYDTLLHRNPQPAEVSGWVGEVNSGALSPAQVATAFVTSDEYRSNFILSQYNHLLHRAPSPGEVAGWLGAMKAGLNEEELGAAFLGSPEYYRDHGSTPDGLVEGFYQDILGRAPDSGGATFWVQTLANGVPAKTVAFDIMNSPESLVRIVTAAYQSVLGRAPDPLGLSIQPATLLQSHSPSGLVASLAASPEFINARGGVDGVMGPMGGDVGSTFVEPPPVSGTAGVVYDPFIPDPVLSAPDDSGVCGCSVDFGGPINGSSGDTGGDPWGDGSIF